MAIHPSTEDEERLVRTFFENEATGYFVEVGVNHPTAGSRTWHLEQSGWTGVLVEPQPDLAAFLVTARKARVFAVACTSPDKSGEALPLSRLDCGRAMTGASPTYTIMVPTRTLDSILQEADAPVPIDLLSVDVSGLEIEVLQGFDFEHWQPLLILVEDHVRSLRTHHYLKSKGYRLLRRLGFNGWYVPADMPLRSTSEERREIIRKYYVALPFRMLRNLFRRIRGR